MEFCFHLAVATGQDVRAVLKYPAPLLGWWQAYFSKHSLPWVRSDIAAAVIAKTVADVNRGKGKPARKLLDFSPFLKAQLKRKISGVEEMKAAFKGLAERMRKRAGVD